jgi:hypothetical protein
MTFKITKASDYNYSDTMVFNSLAELMAFIDENDGKVVIYSEENEIMIYDDYIE